MIKTALISDCGKYRYRLTRDWDTDGPRVLFIMLNPSTADAEKDDNTIRRCIGFARSWGFSGLMVGNLFPYRATRPIELKTANDIHGLLNEVHIQEMAEKCSRVVLAYGNNRLESKALNYLDLDNLYCIDMREGANPKHPLYLKGELKPKHLKLKVDSKIRDEYDFYKKRISEQLDYIKFLDTQNLEETRKRELTLSARGVLNELRKSIAKLYWLKLIKFSLYE